MRAGIHPGQVTASAPVPYAKTVIPQVPANFVQRPEVRQELDRLSAEFPVTLVCAPAGYGKTLLLADWARTAGHADKVWVSLDANDTPERLWSAVLRALRAAAAGRPDDDRQPIEEAAAPAPADFVAGVIDVLAALPAPVHLILDNLHEVVATETLHGIATLIRHQPDTLRLVLSTRTDPPLPLARLRLQGRLAQLRAPRLRFGTAEAAELLRGAGVTLGEDGLRRLVEQTGGWPAGLRLASRLPRADTDDLAGVLAEDRVTADYLTSEVLAPLPAETRAFLQTVSVCDEVSPALASALSEREDAGALLTGLERTRSLVQAGGDHQCFRTHPLLRDFLRADLARRNPTRLADLHAVAAAWFTTHGQPRAAFAHAARTDDTTPAEGLLRRHAVPLLLTGDHGLVDAVLDKVGTTAVARDPLLSLVALLARLARGEPSGEIARPGTAVGELTDLRRLAAATAALVHGAVSPGDEAEWRHLVARHRGGDFEAWARLGLGWSLLSSGAASTARSELELARRLSHDQGFDQLTAHSLVGLAVVAGLNGDYRTMSATSSQALAFAEDTRWRQLSWIVTANVMLGVHRLMRLDVPGALDAARRAEAALTSPGAPPLRSLIDFISGVAALDEGDHGRGLELVHRARSTAADADLPLPVLVTMALVEHQGALAAGRPTLARQVETWTRTRAGEVTELSVMRGRAALARDELPDAVSALRAALTAGAPAVCPDTPLEARLLATAVEARMGRRTQARHSLVAALSLAEQGELIRPFYHADPAVRQLLAEQMGGFGPADDFAMRVRHVLSTWDTPPDNVLTAREQSVLVQLSTPRSLDELAADLSVSVNTVKTHVRAIYSKLGVNNRRAAVMTARHLGLT